MTLKAVCKRRLTEKEGCQSSGEAHLMTPCSHHGCQALSPGTTLQAQASEPKARITTCHKKGSRWPLLSYCWVVFVGNISQDYKTAALC